MNNLFPAQDLRTLFWLRWRQFQDGAVYWLRVLGYQSGESSFMQNMYIVYLLGIGGIWLFTMWAWGYDMATSLGTTMEPAARASILNVLPIGVFVVQILAMIVALRSTPLKLSFADMAYVAGSPLARSVPVLLGFIWQVIVRWVIFGALWALLAVLILGEAAEPVASLRAIGAVMLVVIFTWAGAWMLGILRLVYPKVARSGALWLVPLALLGLYRFWPDLVLWPGRSIVLVIFDLAPVWVLLLLVVLAGGLVLAFVWLSNRIDMVQAADESVVHARLAALGILAWRMPDLQFRIRLQQSYAGRKPRWSLPRAYGRNALVMRSLVSYIRHPVMLVINLIWGAGMTYIAAQILINQLPPQLWIGWLLIAAVAPPVGTLHTYRMDMKEPFLRQFFQFNGLQILVADFALPLGFLIAGALGVWFVIGLPPEIISLGILFIPLLALVLSLCDAVALNRNRPLQIRLLAVALSIGIAVLAGFGLETPLAAVVILTLAVTTMGGMLAQDM